MSKSDQPLVSVVTPVYNGAEYLAECIESVLTQTYQNWEHVIVDNCSTDGTVQIARRYAAKDPRIRVHENQEFLSAIANHNNALRQISPRSKYCKVVFGDDWVFPECLEKMVAIAEEYPTIGLVSAYALKGNEIAWDGLSYDSRFVPGREICRRHFLEKLYVFGSATTVLYRADLIRERKLFYNPANIHADTEVCFDLLRTSDFGFVHQVLTFTRVRPASLREVSNDLQTNLAGTLQTLCAYGRSFVTDREFESLLRQHVTTYYEFLGKSWLIRRDKAFWSYHRRQLADSQVGYSRLRLVMGILTVVVGAMLSPWQTLSKLLKLNRKQRENSMSSSQHGDNKVHALYREGNPAPIVSPTSIRAATLIPTMTPSANQNPQPECPTPIPAGSLDRKAPHWSKESVCGSTPGRNSYPPNE